MLWCLRSFVTRASQVRGGWLPTGRCRGSNKNVVPFALEYQGVDQECGQTARHISS